jgi:hypothetical protein
MVERQLPKLHTRVRFPSPAPTLSRKSADGLASLFHTKKAMRDMPNIAVFGSADFNGVYPYTTTR